MKTKYFIFSFFQLLLALLSLITNWYGLITILLLVNVVLLMLEKLGKGIILRETVALHIVFICLFMPYIGYIFFNRENALAALWVKYMLVPKEQYFGFALPAVSGFVSALCWPIINNGISDFGDFLKNTIVRGQVLLEKRPKSGIYLLVVGTIVLGVRGYLPTTLQFAFLLFYFAAFAGFLYVFYTKTLRFRIVYLIFFSVIIGMNALNSGIFTVVAYMAITLFSFFFLDKKISFGKKIFWFCLGALLLTLIQNIKQQYRDLTWRQTYQGNKVALFTNLMSDAVTNLQPTSANAFFPIYVRTNQGFNISLVMRRIPTVQKVDNGNKLLLSFAAAFVPRFLWADKPEAGGIMNMKYYAGVNIKGWSTNVGPLGEAYGSFGVTGGIIYMCLLGWFIRWAYKLVFAISRSIPLIIFWVPVLFYQVTYSSETDTLQILNSLVKSAFFIWLLYKIIPAWFGKQRHAKSFKTKKIIGHNEGSFVPSTFQ